MSSKAVRDAIEAAIIPLADPWFVYDLSDYHTVREIFNSISSQVVLLQYVIAEEGIQTIGGEGNQGWEESGTVIIHLVVPTGFSSDEAIIKGDEIRTGIRGRRIGVASDVMVESCSPFADFNTDSLGVDGAWHGFAASLVYVRRDCG